MALATEYAEHKITADQFIARAVSLVPLSSGKLQLPDLEAWTQAKPKSHVVWYALGRQYVQIAADARGGKWANDIAKDQFDEADKYANLAHVALLKALTLQPDYIPAYRALLEVEHHVTKPQGGLKDYLAKTCTLLRSVANKRQDVCEKISYPADLSREYLLNALAIDPDQTIVYFIYIKYNNRRWGGRYSDIETLIEQARKQGDCTYSSYPDVVM